MQLELVDRPPLQYVETRSARALTLGLAGLGDATRQVLDGLTPADFALAPADRGRPEDAKPQRPLRVGYDRQVVGYGPGMQALFGVRVHLLFVRPLRPGAAYRLRLPEALAGAGGPVPVVFHPDRASGSIQVNQVGWLPAATKTAYVGNWLGTAGPLPVDARRFRVIKAGDGETVLTGDLTARAPADPWSGNDVYTADLSALNDAGRYRVAVPGIGVSDPFEIGADVYRPAARTVLRLFYHSRNGTPVVAPYADPGHERPEGGVPARLDGRYHPSVGRSMLGCAGDACDGGRPVRRGWFDAGDYGQYVPNAAPVWHAAGAAMDLGPERFGDGDLGIPESGNGVPDLLDELDWGMDWMLSMQDADGGVFFRIASRTWDDTLPHRITEPRLLAEKTTHATAAFAAAAAIHARLLAPYRPRRAAAVLAAAERAWAFIETHPQWPPEGERYRNPRGISAGEYQDKSALDNRLWAAGELYRSTGKQRYLDAYEALAPEVFVDPTAPVSYDKQVMAALWAYLMAAPGDAGAGDPRDPARLAEARKAVLAAADWRIRMARGHPYQAPVHHFIGFVGWGSFAHSTRATLPLLKAHRLTGERRYLDWALRSADTQLGANPQSLCYITGLGARPPRRPLSKLSQYDDNPAPLNGIPVTGPHWRVPASWPQMAVVNDSLLPPAKPAMERPREPADFAGTYPVLRRYTDADLLPQMSEPTVADYAVTGVALMLLGPGEAAASP